MGTKTLRLEIVHIPIALVHMRYGTESHQASFAQTPLPSESIVEEQGKKVGTLSKKDSNT